MYKKCSEEYKTSRSLLQYRSNNIIEKEWSWERKIAQELSRGSTLIASLTLLFSLRVFVPACLCVIPHSATFLFPSPPHNSGTGKQKLFEQEQTYIAPVPNFSFLSLIWEALSTAVFWVQLFLACHEKQENCTRGKPSWKAFIASCPISFQKLKIPVDSDGYLEYTQRQLNETFNSVFYKYSFFTAW